MNIKQELLKEHSKSNAERIAEYACASKEHFAELIECFLGDEKRVAQVAAYSVNKAVKLKPLLIYPFMKDVVLLLEKKNVHGSITRNAVNILELIDIPEEHHAEVMNRCFAFIENPQTDIAVKASSLTVLYNLSKIYPEIRVELKLIIEERWEFETAAFKARGRKILASIKSSTR
jgi:hypothetical protein